MALVGLGAAARGIHGPAFRLSTRTRLVGAADPDATARAQFAKRSPNIPLYADLRRLLDAQPADWVVIAAPPATHRDLCIAALERGLHVFCEKPFVEGLSDADAVLATARRAERQIAVNHEFPRMPIFEATRMAVGSEAFGKLVFSQFWQHVLEHPVEGWRSQGRTMLELGTHAVELMVELHRALPDRVFARMPRFPESGEKDLVDVVTFEFPEGRVASLILDRVCRGAHSYLECRLDGEHASMRASIGGRAGVSVYLSRGNWRPRARLELAPGGRAWLEIGERRRTLARNPSNAFALATARLLDSVVSAVDRGEEPPASGRHARSILAIVEAAYESARSGLFVVPRFEPRDPTA